MCPPPPPPPPMVWFGLTPMNHLLVIVPLGALTDCLSQDSCGYTSFQAFVDGLFFFATKHPGHYIYFCGLLLICRILPRPLLPPPPPRCVYISMIHNLVQWTLIITSTDITNFHYNKLILVVPNFRFLLYCIV